MPKIKKCGGIYDFGLNKKNLLVNVISNAYPRNKAKKNKAPFGALFRV